MIFFSTMRFIIFFLFLNLFAQGPIVLIVGTRPEAIKVIPVYRALKKVGVPALLCATGQHAELLQEVFRVFGVHPDVDFAIMKPGQDLFHIHTAVMENCKEYFEKVGPSMVLVQGDTTSALAGALAAFYCQIPVGHIEAGLRTGNIHRPFPEEMNRKVITTLATLHFAPTPDAVENLRREGVKENVYCTGNTVVDALYSVTAEASTSLREKVEKAQGKKMLLTVHRRELSEEEFSQVFRAVKAAVQKDPTFSVFYPAHPSPKIQKVIREERLDEVISVLPPLSYSELVYLLREVDFVATDSGGIQEEAASLGKPVLCLRKENDRLEKGIGTETAAILAGIESMKKMGRGEANFVYGDGHAAERIVDKIREHLVKENR